MQAYVFRRESSVERPTQSNRSPRVTATAMLFLFTLVALPTFAWQNARRVPPPNGNKAIQLSLTAMRSFGFIRI